MEVLVDTAAKLASNNRATTVPEGMIASQRRSDSDHYGQDHGSEEVQVLQEQGQVSQDYDQSLQGQEKSLEGDGQSVPGLELPKPHAIPGESIGGDFDFDDDKG